MFFIENHKSVKKKNIVFTQNIIESNLSRLIQQMEVGLSKRTIGQWMAPKPSCGSSTRSQTYVSVSIKDINITLKVFVVGVCMSLGIFLLELIHYFWMNRIIMCKDKINLKHFTWNVFVRRN